MVSGIAFEEVAAEMAVGLEVSDHGFDGRAASEFALDDAEDAAFLAGDEHAARIGHGVAAIALST